MTIIEDVSFAKKKIIISCKSSNIKIVITEKLTHLRPKVSSLMLPKIPRSSVGKIKVSRDFLRV